MIDDVPSLFISLLLSRQLLKVGLVLCVVTKQPQIVFEMCLLIEPMPV